MREILFKAKRLDNGEWVEGWYCEYPFRRWPLKPTIIPAQLAIDGTFEFVDVDPSTVGQYTGLKDKNGKRIFEGDNIRWTDWKGEQKEAPVCYDPEWNRFCVWLNGAESMGVNKHLSTGGIEIINSIHDGEGGQ